MPQITDKSNSALAKMLKEEFASKGQLKEGDVADAVLIKKTSREAFFDLGKFGTGEVYGIEFQNAKEVLKNAKVGDTLPAKIKDIENERGFVELSLVEAGKQKLWQEIQALEESGAVIKVKVIGANQKGLIVDLLGIKAFLPISQLSSEHLPAETLDKQKMVESLKKLTGKELDVKVVDTNPHANKATVSERETLSANIKELLSRYEIGQIVEGIVSGIADFGVFVRFVDNPEIEGLIHVSELDHRLSVNPKDIVKVSETVKVKIIDIKDGKVFLSLKALKEDPWQNIGEKLKEGEIVSGKVYDFNPFGAIINLESGVQGVIHVSEFGGVDEMKKALAPGESYSFIIEAIKPQEKRILLKLKR